VCVVVYALGKVVHGLDTTRERNIERRRKEAKDKQMPRISGPLREAQTGMRRERMTRERMARERMARERMARERMREERMRRVRTVRERTTELRKARTASQILNMEGRLRT
jgi:hypothetical protein